VFLAGLVAWLLLLMFDNPVLVYFARAWAIVWDGVAGILLAIWHFLGG